MGNCVVSNGISVQNEGDIEQEREAEESIQRVRSLSSSLKLESERSIGGGKNKKKKNKTVRFKLHEEEDDNGKGSRGYSSPSKGEGVRVRLVVTQGELIQILNNRSNYSSVEQLLNTIRLKDRKVSQVRTSNDDETNGGWRPALDSIPEDH